MPSVTDTLRLRFALGILRDGPEGSFRNYNKETCSHCVHMQHDVCQEPVMRETGDRTCNINWRWDEGFDVVYPKFKPRSEP